MTQTTLPRVAPDDMSELARSAWSRLTELTGDASFVEVFAAAPELLEFVMQRFYGEIFFAGRLEQRYKQLARLKLSMIHGCRTCNKQNVPGALEAGITQAEIDALEQYQSGPFTDADKAVLKFTELMAIDNQSATLSPELSDELQRHFTAAQICELGTVTAVISGMAKLSFVLDLVEREPGCRFEPA